MMTALEHTAADAPTEPPAVGIVPAMPEALAPGSRPVPARPRSRAVLLLASLTTLRRR